MNLFFDIETIPTQRDDLKELIAKKISHPGTMTKPETIEKWNIEKRAGVFDEKYRATALNGTLGEIVCIGYAFDDEEPQALYRGLDEPEYQVLDKFSGLVHRKATKAGFHQNTKVMRSIKWIGHNSTGFDLRFLWQRYVINNIRPLIDIPYDAKPWDDTRVADTKVMWTGLTGKGGSLNEISRALGYPGKGNDIDGSKVWDYVKAGKIKEVAEYCKNVDVVQTRLIYNRMIFAGL